MKDFKKRWEEELNNVVPELSDEVKNAPIVTETDGIRPAPWYARLFGTPRRIAAFASTCAVCVVAVGTGLYFGLRSTESGAPAYAGEVISVEINPQAMFSVDKSGKVNAVVAANEDADIILSGDRAKEMKGKPVADAVQIFVDYSARLGYLNLSEPDAIRVSSCAEDGQLSAVDAALENYFQSKGAYVVVVRETVSPETFCQRMGLQEVSSMKDLLADVAELSGYFFERGVDDTTDTATLQTIYGEKLSFEDIQPLFEDEIRSNIERIEKSIADLDEIQAQNELIKEHADNPYKILMFSRDYWTVKTVDGSKYTEAFAAEMSKMETLLVAYEKEYGVTLKSVGELETAVQACYALPIKTLHEILENFTVQVFEEHLSEITELLRNVGADLSKFTSAYKLPESYGEYLSLMENYANMQFDHRMEANKNVYEESRTEIPAEEYGRFMDGLEKEHGSLSAYFEGKNKK